MRAAVFALLPTVAMFSGASEAAARPAKADAGIEAMAACAVAKNGGDVVWAYIVQSGQSGLDGRTLDGASAYALFLMARDCAADGVRFDNKRATAFSGRAFALLAGDTSKSSAARPIDAWADCLADHETARGKGYLFARDAGFAGGPKFIVNGVDPTEAIFESSAGCDSLKPADRASINLTDLYARLNYRLRVQPRLAVTDTRNEKN